VKSSFKSIQQPRATYGRASSFGGGPLHAVV